jgi:hypothetical protein
VNNKDISARLFFPAFPVALCFIVLVFPNALRLVSVPLLFISAFLGLYEMRWTENQRFAATVMSASVFVTVFYVFVAALNGHCKFDVQMKIAFIYIVSPALWLITGESLLEKYGAIRLSRIIIALGFIGTLTVYYYIAAYYFWGPGSLTWLIGFPHITLVDGIPAIRMHVFGTLLFVGAGFFACPSIVEHRHYRYAVGISIVVAAALSGRSALIVAILCGMLLQLCHTVRERRLTWHQALATVIIAGLMIGVGMIWGKHLGIDIARVAAASIEKIRQLGGSARSEQVNALWRGIIDSWFLGAGHGVNVSVIRSDESPWQYEMLWHATVFRVGLLGAFVYVVPAVTIVTVYWRRCVDEEPVPGHTRFMFGGFVGSFLGSATNPYLESFDFQWMYVLPFLYFAHIRQSMLSAASSPAQLQR